MSLDYTLYYWPIPFRGHIPRFILAEAGAAWDEPGFDEMLALKDADPEDQPTPFMGPPLLHHHASDTWLSQMPAIAMALGRRHGLCHDPDLDLRLACDASDVLLEITNSHGAQMWDHDDWTAFRADRLPRWMRMHDRIAARAGDGWLSGTDAPGLGDLSLGALWHTMADRLPPLRADLDSHAPALADLADRVAARPAIADLRASWDDSPWRYCAGQIEASILDMLERDDRQ